MQVLADRSVALWLLGYPEAALTDADHALEDARKCGRAASLFHVLNVASQSHMLCSNYSAAGVAERVRDRCPALPQSRAAFSIRPASVPWRANNSGWFSAISVKSLSMISAIRP
jgi:hypothetical protein